MPHSIHRRQFLLVTSALSLSAAVGGRANAGESVQLRPAATRDLFRVRMEMSLEGNVDIPKNVLVSKERDRQLPLSATSVIDFEERWVRDERAVAAAANRYYYEASSEATINQHRETRELRSQARRVIAQLDEGRPVLYGEREYLTHDELDLLRTPVCSLSIDAILPLTAVSEGDTWTPPSDALARLFNLAGVQKSTVTAELTSIDAKQAKLQLQGRIDGSVDGVPTAIDLAGKAVYDRQAGAVTWLALALREQREIGKAEPGFQVAARIKLIRQPLEKANAVREPEPIDLSVPPPAGRTLVHILSKPGQFTAFMDRNWRVISDAEGLTTVRMVRNDEVVAQCDVRPLVALKAGEQLTLEAFQIDVKRSLAARFGSFLEAEEGVNSSGLRTLRIAAQGEVQKIPVQWVFLHFSDDNGRRVAATFTLEATQVESFGGADAQFANSFRFAAEPAPASEAQAAKQDVNRKR